MTTTTPNPLTVFKSVRVESPSPGGLGRTEVGLKCADSGAGKKKRRFNGTQHKVTTGEQEDEDRQVKNNNECNEFHCTGTVSVEVKKHVT